jgi:hypothetical protein
MGRTSLHVSLAPSRVRRVARSARTGAPRSSKAPRGARTGARDLRGASVVNRGGVTPHVSGVPTKTSECSPRSDGGCRGSSGNPTPTERCRGHAHGRSRYWDRRSRSSQSGRASLCRRSRSSESVPPHGGGCSIPLDRYPAHSEGLQGQHRRRLHEIEATPWKKHGQLYREKAMLCAHLGTLSLFAGMPCEGEDGIREEAREYRAVLSVPAPSRKRRRGREEGLSQRKATLRAHLGTPSMGFEMPSEERTMPTVTHAALHDRTEPRSAAQGVGRSPRERRETRRRHHAPRAAGAVTDRTK